MAERRENAGASPANSNCISRAGKGGVVLPACSNRENDRNTAQTGSEKTRSIVNLNEICTSRSHA